MKSIFVLAIFCICPFIVIGQQTDSLENQISIKRQDLAKMRWELDSMIAKSDLRAAQTLYAELGGVGGWISVNYEQRFGKGLNKNLSWRVGLGYSTWNISSGSFAADSSTLQSINFIGIATLPIMLNYFTDGDGSPYHFEVGAGIVPWFGTERTTQYERLKDTPAPPMFVYQAVSVENNNRLRFYAPVSIGYRYQPADGGFFFKVSAMALFNGSYGNFPVLPWIGFSFGETYAPK
jgi:hypothetical protein